MMKYYVTVLPGLEEVTMQEMGAKHPSAKILTPLIGRGNILMPFETSDDPAELFDIKTAEDIFVYLGEMKRSEARSDLDFLSEFILQMKTLDPALAAHRKTQPTKKKKTTFRVVAQAIHDPKGYRRVDFQQALEKAIWNRYNQKWDIVEDEAQLEIWVHLLDNKKTVFGLRLSDRTMRHREYKVEHLPASLRPTMAYALVWLSRIEADDVFLDPMCGAGTILIERAQAGAYRELLGGDINPDAIKTTRANIGNNYKPIELRVWDAKALPLEAASVDKIVCNLPFGKQIGSHEDNVQLYRLFFKEAERVLKSGGRGVFLTSESQLIKIAISHHPQFKVARSIKSVSLLGQRADIFVVDKK